MRVWLGHWHISACFRNLKSEESIWRCTANSHLLIRLISANPVQDVFPRRDRLNTHVSDEFVKVNKLAGNPELCSCRRQDQWDTLVETRIGCEDALTSSQRRPISLGCVPNARARTATWASLLRHYGEVKALSLGRCVHALIAQSSDDCNTFVGNCLVEMYGNCGNVQDSQAVFDHLPKTNTYSWNILIKAYIQNRNLDVASNIFGRMPCRDVVSWTAMIAAFSQNGHGKEALDLFRKMQLEGVAPNKITFVCTLDACGSLVALGEGQEIHNAITELKYEQDVVVGTALINMYGKCESLHHAKSVFCSMLHWDVVSWNAMIAALAQNGHGKEALDHFGKMQLEGLLPDKISFLSCLDACSTLAVIDMGHDIHAAIVVFEYEQDTALENSLVNMYGKCGSLMDAKTVFGRISSRNVVSWNAMITSLVENGNSRQALIFFHQMQIEGIITDKITFVSALAACASLGVLEEGQEVHAVIEDREYGQDVGLRNALINMYGKCGNINQARDVFEKLSNRDAASWNAMIVAFSNNGLAKEALDLFWKMQFEGMKPNKITFVCVLVLCATHTVHAAGQEIHASLIKGGHEQDVIVGNALLNMYGRCGYLPDATSVFDKMLHRDVISWTIMIASFAQNGEGKVALNSFGKMHLDGIKPDDITFLCALSACNHNGQVDDSKMLLTSVNTNRSIAHAGDPHVVVVDLLGRSGCLDEAEHLIKRVPAEKVAAAWLCLLSACRICKDVERGVRAAKHCFELDPNNAAAYVMLSEIFSAAGDWDNVAVVRQALKSKGMRGSFSDLYRCEQFIA